MATNAAYDTAGLNPLTDTYPPGSTFKIVTATAAFQHGVSSSSAVTCPKTVHIGPRTIPNEDGVIAGDPPDYATQVHTAFAKSCNTTFAQLAANLGTTDLPTAAKQLGLGVDFDIPGMTTNTGRVDPAADEVDRAVDGFGQGTDLVSPFGMAVVAATVHNGQVPAPVLIRGQQTTANGKIAAPSASVLAQVRTMMREVCTSGTARSLASLPNTYGKTGTAEVGDGPAHGWFVGYHDDIAFAVLLPHAERVRPRGGRGGHVPARDRLSQLITRTAERIGSSGCSLALLLLGPRRTAPAPKLHAGLGQHPVHEAVGAPRGLRERADAGALLVLLLQVSGQLVPRGPRDPGALLQVSHLVPPSVGVQVGPRTAPVVAMIEHDGPERQAIKQNHRSVIVELPLADHRSE